MPRREKVQEFEPFRQAEGRAELVRAMPRREKGACKRTLNVRGLRDAACGVLAKFGYELRVSAAGRLRPAAVPFGTANKTSLCFWGGNFGTAPFSLLARSPSSPAKGGVFALPIAPTRPPGCRPALNRNRSVRTERAAASPREGPLLASAGPLVCVLRKPRPE